MKINHHISHPVKLKEGKIESFSDALNLIIEYGLFFRWIYFKNRPRGNLLLLRGILGVSFWASIIVYAKFDWKLILMGIDIDPLIAYFFAVGLSYHSMASVFYRKSESCSQMYTEMLKAGGAGNIWCAKALSNALAIELLTLDLWAHRKYRGLFSKNLFRSIEHAYSTNSALINMDKPSTMEKLIDIVNKGELQAKEARILLDNYQDYLMYAMNKHYSGENTKSVA